MRKNPRNISDDDNRALPSTEIPIEFPVLSRRFPVLFRCERHKTHDDDWSRFQLEPRHGFFSLKDLYTRKGLK